ncbi:lymphocyte antigen 75-like [Silurus asotus]|uniref:Lymphocyte antigen 75-like n=1 Tax=Silurus asotus TaxID=30991 RepID=A0AAD5FI94_SILAS|nr:lymphocyte antigen 75-like [Silurus asotus]
MKSAQVLLLLAGLTGSTTCLLLRKYIFVSIPSSWNDAQTYCREHYIDISTIDSVEELNQYKMDIADNVVNRSWIGLSKRPDERNFVQWSDGSVFGFASWLTGQPDGPTSQHCATIVNAFFADFFCTNILPFICYIWEPSLIMVQEMKTWHEALVYCRTQYTDLISLNTERDLLAVNNMVGKFDNVSVWIGLNFLDGSWFWVNNETLSNPVLLPSCPIKPLHCGAKPGVSVLENKGCMEKMNFICYHTQGYVKFKNHMH